MIGVGMPSWTLAVERPEPFDPADLLEAMSVGTGEPLAASDFGMSVRADEWSAVLDEADDPIDGHNLFVDVYAPTNEDAARGAERVAHALQAAGWSVVLDSPALGNPRVTTPA